LRVAEGSGKGENGIICWTVRNRSERYQFVLVAAQGFWGGMRGW